MTGFAGSGKKGPKPLPKSHVPQIVGKNCLCCISEFRGYIDRMLIAGVPQREIADFLGRIIGKDVHHTAVGRHYRNHLDLKQRALRKIMEKRIAGEIDDVDAAAGDLLNRKAMVEMVAHKGFTDIVEGSVRFTVGEWLSAMDRLDAADREETGASIAEMQRETMALVHAIQSIVPAPMLKQILDLYSTNLGKKPELVPAKRSDDAISDELAEDAEWEDE